ncbi:glycosyltransferase 61 family protein [Specibacter sp. NPDC078692]|uniref:glycosyltransferase 61 family protein n=1 Tax=Specibacter sp. NPDC078692 TaxID=3155818 RepID=UPI003420FD5C
MDQQFDVSTIGDLKYMTMRDAKVLPGALTSSNGTVRGGIAPVDGSPVFMNQLRQVNGEVVSLNRFRHGDPTGFGRKGELPAYFSGTYIYLGPLHRHFGHFVTESMTRIWYSLLATSPDLELVVLPEVDSIADRDSFCFDNLQSWQKDIFRYFGTERLHFVRSMSIFENLIVPQQGGILFSESHSETYLGILTARRIEMLGKAAVKAKVFYQRPENVPTGKVAGEEYIATFLSTCGYLAVFPEKLSGAEQIQIAATASKAISTQGSALHAFNLLGRNGVDVLVLQRSATSALKAFSDTVEPYVNSMTIHEPAVNLPGENHSSGLQILDVEVFLIQLTEFDEDIDPKLFDYAAFYGAVLKDMQLFLQSVPK